MTPAADPQVRFAHFLVDIPAFDICVRGPDDADFVGPLIRNNLGRMGGVSYGFASGYVPLKAVAYKARVVAGSATGCGVPFAGVPDVNFIPLVAGKRYTVAPMGNPLATFQSPKIQLLEDDISVQASQVRLRFLNAVEGATSYELGSGSGGTYARIFGSAAYGSLGDASGNPYSTQATVTGGTFSLRIAGAGTDTLTLMNKVTLTAGAVYTATAMGATGSGTSPISISLCNDSAMPTNGLLPCSELR